MIRPMTNSGRPVSGYARPGTNRPITGANWGNLTTAMAGNKPGTSRPITSGGRLLRLGTASML
jgi:tetratricopeptide repeat protein 8